VAALDGNGFVEQPYAEYEALLTDTATITAVVKKNQLSGTPVWSGSDGVYDITLTGAFPIGNRTVVYFGPVNDADGSTVVIKKLHTTANAMTITTYVDGSATAGNLSQTAITIRVYPS
jgi:hypothetical protein